MTTDRRRIITPGVAAPGLAPRLGETIDSRRGVAYRAMRAASLVNRSTDQPRLFGFTVNPYRGCEMGCRYCYARYTHEFLGLGAPGAFERIIYVKRIDAGRLLGELTRARRSGLTVAIGTATDPYQPAEARFRVARSVLEAARRVPGLSLSITTKGTLVTRDLDLLQAIGRQSALSVNFSLTTVDARLARRLEPRAPRPDLRLGAMRALAEAGVATRLFVKPILPFLTEGEDNIRSLLVEGGRAGARAAGWNVLFLRDPTRSAFFAFLAAEFPRLVGRYRRLYAGSPYARPEYVAEVEARVRRLAAEVGMPMRSREERTAEGPAQLALVW
ncbi:MAG: radical SAM protein [Candidatus Rokubacteria bacterium]|nr:radical SAM protein [Candidatus Rokubacteria bacterium]